MEFVVINTGNSTPVPVRPKSSSEHIQKLIGEDYVKLDFESPVPVNLGINDYIEVFGRKFFLNTMPVVTKKGDRLFAYECSFEGYVYDLGKVSFLDTDAMGIHVSHEFFLTGKLEDFLGIIRRNLARIYPPDTWDCINTLTGIHNETKTLSFSEDTCLSALRKICSEYGTEYDIVENQSGQYLRSVVLRQLGGYVNPTALQYGKGKGLVELKRKNASNSNFITKIFAFGSSKNLGPNYRNFSPRLKLAGNESSALTNDEAVAAHGVFEKVVIFDDVFPHRTGTVTGIGDTIVKFSDSSMFDLNETLDGNSLYLLPGLEAKVHFNTGNLAGYEFKIFSYTHQSRTFTLLPYTDERGMVFPSESSTAFQINEGDEYVLIDIKLPQSYVDTAEAELLEKAQEWIGRYSNPQIAFDIKIDELFLRNEAFNFGIGNILQLVDSDINTNLGYRIVGVSRNLVRETVYDISLSEDVFRNKSGGWRIGGINNGGYKTSVVINEHNRLHSITSPADHQAVGAQDMNKIVATSATTGQIELIEKNSLDKTYRHIQSIPSTEWQISHNLGKYPSVTTTDTGGNEVEGEVKYINSNSVLLTFSAAFAGYADCN